MMCSQLVNFESFFEQNIWPCLLRASHLNCAEGPIRPSNRQTSILRMFHTRPQYGASYSYGWMGYITALLILANLSLSDLQLSNNSCVCCILINSGLTRGKKRAITLVDAYFQWSTRRLLESMIMGIQLESRCPMIYHLISGMAGFRKPPRKPYRLWNWTTRHRLGTSYLVRLTKHICSLGIYAIIDENFVPTFKLEIVSCTNTYRFECRVMRPSFVYDY